MRELHIKACDITPEITITYPDTDPELIHIKSHDEFPDIEREYNAKVDFKLWPNYTNRLFVLLTIDGERQIVPIEWAGNCYFDDDKDEELIKRLYAEYRQFEDACLEHIKQREEERNR